MSTSNTPFDSIRNDDDVRAGTEELAERDGKLGALARITLAIADGQEPNPDDCEEAGLETLPKLARGEE
ncbi:hypothetical protein [Salinilacihabitans rarus]|uniref:hypothetical protein n=1 Tax=Salinilacihabitans rarus TaxID=2961596 RepID=UPI0020C8D6FE|nr:hypothetical protein [Salinilacihabitans rarus]